jgi:hypothetical protein
VVRKTPLELPIRHSHAPIGEHRAGKKLVGLAKRTSVKCARILWFSALRRRPASFRAAASSRVACAESPPELLEALENSRPFNPRNAAEPELR